MPVTLGNRAFEAINRVLGLFGGQTVDDIDIDQAFSVYDLSTIVQAAQVGYWRMVVESTTGAGTERLTLSPWTAADWDEMIDPAGRIFDPPAQADMPGRELELYLVSAGVVTTTGGANNAGFFLRAAMGTTFNYTIPVTTLAAGTGPAEAGTSTIVEPDGPMFLQRMPLRLRSEVALALTPMVQIGWGGAGTTGITCDFITAEPGVIPRAF